MTGSNPLPARRPRLAIVIPAFGRGKAIAAAIADMAAEAKACDLSIAFYVSDDTADDEVEDLVRPLLEASMSIFYRRNRPALGHDRNVIASLIWPNADYIWPIGSNFRAKKGGLATILDFLNRQDLVFVNDHADWLPRVVATSTDEGRLLIRDILWHQTMTGTTIYSRAVCDWVIAVGEKMKLIQNFPQVCTILGYAEVNEVSVGWFDAPSLQPSGSNDQSYWRKKAIDVFARDWGTAVEAFPVIIPKAYQARVIKEHSRQTKLFNTSTLMDLRANGQLRWGSLRDARVRKAMHLPAWKLLLLLALPLRALRLGSKGLATLKEIGSN